MHIGFVREVTGLIGFFFFFFTVSQHLSVCGKKTRTLSG